MELMPLDLRVPTLARCVVVEVLRDVAKRCEGWNLVIEVDEVGKHLVLHAHGPCGESRGATAPGQGDEKDATVDRLAPHLVAGAWDRQGGGKMRRCCTRAALAQVVASVRIRSTSARSM